MSGFLSGSNGNGCRVIDAIETDPRTDVTLVLFFAHKFGSGGIEW